MSLNEFEKLSSPGPEAGNKDLKLILISNQPEIARFVVARGVEWIMVDLERLGKQDRQGHLDTFISEHELSDVVALRRVVPQGRLIVRTDPLNRDSRLQIDALIEAGADWLMLPYFRKVREVQRFVGMVAGRAKVMLLAETADAARDIGDFCSIDGVDRIHIGLNDLSLDLGRRFMFELLVDGTVDRMAASIRDSGLPFGIGGIARIGEGLLPAENILALHSRLGSDAAILSRTFHRNAASLSEVENQMNFAAEAEKIQQAFSIAQSFSPAEHATASNTAASAIARIAENRSSPKNGQTGTKR